MKTSTFGRFDPVNFVSLLLWSLIEVSSSSNATQAPHLIIQPAQPDNTYFSLTGSTFLLNCTIKGENVPVFDLSWWHNGEQLSRSKTRQIDNATLQLQLLNAKTTDNGIYWCNQISDTKSGGINISLSVADPPSPPRNLKWSAIGAMKREYRLYWEASSYTGGLPIDYSIKLCLNDSVMKPALPSALTCKWIDKCHYLNAPKNERHLSCILKATDDFIPVCGTGCSYSIYVVATNAVRSTTSAIFLPIVHLFEATPWPPEELTVKQLSNRNQEYKVSWAEKRDWRYTVIEYTVLYHTWGDKHNKTAVVKNKQFTILIGLKAFTYYYVYLKVRFLNDDYPNSAYSDIVGPRIIRTSPGVPVNPPVVVRDRSDIFPGNSGLRNVTVEWKLADISSWRGTPGKYTVFCKPRNVGKGQAQTLEYSIDATSNKTTLPKLNSRTKYNVYLKMCNKEKKCSNTGESYIIKEVQEKETQPNYQKKLSTIQIVLLSISAVMVFVAVLCVVYLFRKWRCWEAGRHTPNFQPLGELIHIGPPANDYEYVNSDASAQVEGDYDEIETGGN